MSESLNTFSPVSDHRSILSWTFLTGMPSSSVILLRGIFQTTTLYHVQLFRYCQWLAFCVPCWCSHVRIGVLYKRKKNYEVNTNLNSIHWSIQLIFSTYKMKATPTSSGLKTALLKHVIPSPPHLMRMAWKSSFVWKVIRRTNISAW